MRFYTGTMFPAKYQGAIFIARHGPWNKSKKYAADIVVASPSTRTARSRKVEPFLTGLVENNGYLGRPVDVLVLKDGSLLVSDDHNGAVYRISYSSSTLARGVALAALLLLAPAALRSRRASFEERTALCLACHGPAGQSLIPETPSIGGQPFFFVVAQLFLFRRGGRANAAMSEVAKPMTDDDLRAFGEWVSQAAAAPAARGAGGCRPHQARGGAGAAAALHVAVTTPTSRVGSRCRAWRTSARSICSGPCASTRAAPGSATARR